MYIKSISTVCHTYIICVSDAYHMYISLRKQQKKWTYILHSCWKLCAFTESRTPYNDLVLDLFMPMIRVFYTAKKNAPTFFC